MTSHYSCELHFACNWNVQTRTLDRTQTARLPVIVRKLETKGVIVMNLTMYSID